MAMGMFPWRQIQLLLARALSWTGVQTFASLVATTADINAGTFDGVVGDTNPAAGTFSPVKAKGPAIITTFAGTVTATASTTVTFSSAADAILAGYSATNPILGTTLISNALTRYIVSWTNATTCVVDSVVTWAGTAITSTQLPISTFVDSSGVTKGWISAAGYVVIGNVASSSNGGTFLVRDIDVGTGVYTVGLMNVFSSDAAGANKGVSIGLGGETGQPTTPLTFAKIRGASKTGGYAGYFSIFVTNGLAQSIEQVRVDDVGNIFTGGLIAAGTSAAKVLGIASGTAPTTSPADAAQMWVADRGAVAGDAALHMRDEVGTNGPVAFAVQRVITQAATDTLTLNEVMGTVISNYGQAAENTQTLPTAAAGYKGRVSISTTGTGAFHLKAGASDKIYLNGTALDDGDKASLAAPVVGDYFDFWTIQTGASAYDWVVVSGVGILVDGGA